MQSTMDELKIEIFDLSLIIKSIIDRYEYLKNDGYQIVLDIPKNAFVKADKKKINQVVYNLINNALNYTGDDKKVTIRVTDEKKDYLVEIIDTGKGIKKEDMNRVWDRYYKNEKNHKRDIIGTGLGLSIVKGILESHKFDYGFNSIIGEGTTFFFRIKKVNKRKV
jgi:signal transduction histidine kinase